MCTAMTRENMQIKLSDETDHPDWEHPTGRRGQRGSFRVVYERYNVHVLVLHFHEVSPASHEILSIRHGVSPRVVTLVA